ncbi:hypothetical protein C8R46DRAFT_668485 [Mycena filopes]|nr:hypothetical protein C8R46DRAFT_668485 [Mycena filopes]
MSHPAPLAPLPVELLPVSPLNVPRRKTLCTATVRAGEPPAYDATTMAHSRAVSSSWATPRRRLPISIDVSPGAVRKIRPLPQIPPVPMSAPPGPRRQISQPSLRPLPSLPELAVTPASPSSPLAHVPQSSAHLSPPPSRNGTPHRFASISLRLDTSPRALAPPPLSAPLAAPVAASLPPSPPPSPPCPSIPQPPSPATAHQRRMSKLRRHLGESVELDLFLDPADRKRKSDIYAQTIVAVKKLLDLDANDSDSSSEEDEEEYSLVFNLGHARRAVPVKRYSRKWIREQGGERWVEENYSDLLRDLRAL